jgi:Tfp pilus assembly protein PilV
MSREEITGLSGEDLGARRVSQSADCSADAYKVARAHTHSKLKGRETSCTTSQKKKQSSEEGWCLQRRQRAQLRHRVREFSAETVRRNVSAMQSRINHGSSF